MELYLKRNKKKVIRAVSMLVSIISLAMWPITANAQTLTDVQRAFVDQHFEICLRLSVENNMPWQTPMAQAIVESQSGDSYAAVKRHNFHGIGKRQYSSDADGWGGYFENLHEITSYAPAGVFNHVDDAKACLDALIRGHYNPYPERYRRDVGAYIDAVEKYRLERGWPTTVEAEALRDAYIVPTLDDTPATDGAAIDEGAMETADEANIADVSTDQLLE